MVTQEMDDAHGCLIHVFVGFSGQLLRTRTVSARVVLWCMSAFNDTDVIRNLQTSIKPQ